MEEHPTYQAACWIPAQVCELRMNGGSATRSQRRARALNPDGPTTTRTDAEDVLSEIAALVVSAALIVSLAMAGRLGLAIRLTMNHASAAAAARARKYPRV